MDRAWRHRNRQMLWGLALAAVCAQAQARTAEVKVERVSTSLARIEGLQASLSWPETAESGQLTLVIASLDASELGYRFRHLTWRCPLQRRAETHWTCSGAVSARGSGTGTLAAEWKDGVVRLSLGDRRGHFAVEFPAGESQPVTLRGRDLPAVWLQSLLATRWSEGRITAGRLDAELQVRSRAEGGSELVGPLAFEQLGLDSRDGRIAAAGLDVEGRLTIGFLPDSTRIELDSQWRGGEVLFGAFYATLPSSIASLKTTLRSEAASLWRVERFDWRDPGVFELQASGVLATDSSEWLRELQATFSLGSLQSALPRYFDSLLGTLGVAGLSGSGALTGKVALNQGAPTTLSATMQNLSLKDGQGRFEVEGLGGDLDWTSAAQEAASGFAWQGARLHDLAFGPARLDWRSVARRLELRAPAAMSLFDGSFRLERFVWTPRQDATQGAAFDLGLALERIDLARLSTALGWPAFAGTVSGRIPEARYAEDVLSLDGGLDADVFAGKVRIGAMSLERPFGVAPTLSADVDFQSLDLQPLTSAFGFGEITGRLDGRIGGLRVVDWSPVAFDADLHSSPGFKGPRRISQRAVNDLSRVGGAGLVAGLQSQVLKLFETFGYSRIGLKCRLADNICHMGGVDSSGAGYTIVEGSGLPRITVIGHQRQVDWPVLVARLKAATQGQTPIVD